MSWDHEEEIVPAPPKRDVELTLSATTLLVLFFVLVFMCGACFIGGYSAGIHSYEPAAVESVKKAVESAAIAVHVRSKPKAAPPQIASSHPAMQKAVPPKIVPAPKSAHPHPAATRWTVKSTSPAPVAAPAKISPAPPQPVAATAKVMPALKQPVVKQSVVKQPVAVPLASETKPPSVASIPPAPGPSPVAHTKMLMVQIAAIPNENDANVLVGALRKRGYEVSTHREASDHLVHVRVGPFNNRGDATDMSKRLLHDGYNAVIQ